MDGTHKRMLEAIRKHVHIRYICWDRDQAHYMADVAERLYEPYGFKRVAVDKLYQPDHTSMMFLSIKANPNLRGFSGAVLIHPDVYDTQQWKTDYQLQEETLHANMRTRPWLN